jgi:archaellum component FlaC
MWTAIALIAIASIAAGAWRRKGSHKDDKGLQELNERMSSIEQNLAERIETLERIVTDSKEDLKRQFDHLDKTG